MKLLKRFPIKWTVWISLLTAGAILVSPLKGTAVKPPVPSEPYAYVMDLAGIIEPTVERILNLYLRELEMKTSAQVVILTVDTLEGVPIEEFSIRLVERWKLGQKDKDNGVLITVAVSDRKYRFEIGYGLEPVLPDSFVGSLGRKYFVPYFRKGRFSEGILLATRAIAEKIARAEGVTLEPIKGLKAQRQAPAVKKKLGLFDLIIGAIFLSFAICLFIRHPWLFLLMFMGGPRSGGWSSGGGGFGGFGGGGGGGFGGGGASGGW